MDRWKRTKPAIYYSLFTTHCHVISPPAFRLNTMETTARKPGVPEWLIVIGCCGFILVLAISAVWQADIRWLHFFQAWMYLATIVLALRQSRWGYFIGISAAGLWDYQTLFVISFFVNGLHELPRWFQTGQLHRPDQFIAVPGWFSNLLVVAGCLWAYSRLPEKRLADLARFAVIFIGTTGFFAIDMAIFQPRYLAIFPRLLHPHLPRI